jgi:hypothetical protein
MKDSLNTPYNVMRHKSWEHAPRVPAIATYLFPAAMAAGGVAAFAALAVTYIGVSMVTSWALNALAPKPSLGGGGQRGLLTNTREATAVQDIVYGEVRKGGVITYLESTGSENKYLHMIISMAGHEINSFEQIYINDETISTDANGFVTDSAWADGDGNKKILIKEFTGTANQNVYSTLSGITDGPQWQGKDTGDDTNFRGQGIACLYVRLEFHQDVFAQGIPLFTARIKGKKVEDPRTSTTAYSNNAALCIRDYLISKYGLDSSGDTNDTTFSTAANVCDESVSLDAGGTENRYEINGVINLSQSPGDILADMMTSCAGTLFWGQGKWHLKAGDYTSSVQTFTLDDFRGPITLETKHSRRNNFNVVRGTFVDANQDYVRADYPEIRSTVWIAEDNDIESAIDLTLPLTTSGTMAQRLAKMTLFRSREQMTMTADFSLKALDVEVGDIVAITNARYGMTAKEFEVVGWRFFNDGDAGDQRVNLTLRETSSAAFDWNAEEEDIDGNDPNLPSGTSDLTITNLVAQGGGRTTSDGTFINSVILTWTAPSDFFISYYDVEWKATADSNYNATTTTQGSIELSPLVDGVQYTIRVRAVTASGRRGPYATVTFTGGGDTTAPGLPTNISATGGYKYIRLDWTDPTDADFNYVEVYEGDSSSATEGPELITDGDFSESSIGFDNVANWTVTKQNSSDTVFVVESATHHGSGVKRINVFDFGTTAIGSLAQDISTTSGETYTLSFYSDSASNEVPSGVFVVITGSSQISSTEITAVDQEVEIEFTANSSTTEIKFDVQETDADAIFTLVSVKANDPLAKVGTSSGASFTRTNLGLSQTKYYFLKSVDFTGNKSAFTSPVSATTSYLDDDDFENGVRQLFINAGLDIIEPVASLPPSGDFTGQQVFLTSTNRLYYWTGSAWDTVVAGAESFSDLNGSIAQSQIPTGVIDSTQIATNAITSGKISANAVGASAIAANSIYGSNIVAGQITGTKIAAETITGGLLNTSGIITYAAQIENGLIENAKIANLAVERAKIGNNAANEVFTFSDTQTGLANHSPFTDSFGYTLGDPDDGTDEGYSNYQSFTLDFEGNSATEVDVIIWCDIDPIGGFASNSIIYRYLDLGGNNMAQGSRFPTVNEWRTGGELCGASKGLQVATTLGSSYDNYTLRARWAYKQTNVNLSLSQRGFRVRGVVWVRYR